MCDQFFHFGCRVVPTLAGSVFNTDPWLPSRPVPFHNHLICVESTAVAANAQTKGLTALPDLIGLAAV